MLFIPPSFFLFHPLSLTLSFFLLANFCHDLLHADEEDLSGVVPDASDTDGEANSLGPPSPANTPPVRRSASVKVDRSNSDRRERKYVTIIFPSKLKKKDKKERERDV